MRRQFSNPSARARLAPAASNDRVNEIHAQQVRDLRELFRYRLHPKNNAAALAEAVRALRERYRQQLERDQRAKVRESTERAQEAWIAYRDATPAFYCEALKLSDCGAVATDLLTTLTERRIEDLTPKSRRGRACPARATLPETGRSVAEDVPGQRGR